VQPETKEPDISTQSVRKDSIRKVSGVLAAVCARRGEMTKEEARELCGLSESEFEEVYEKAGRLMAKLENVQAAKMDRFLEHYAKEIEDYVKDATRYWLLT